jgi:hypothetical protein
MSDDYGQADHVIEMRKLALVEPHACARCGMVSGVCDAFPHCAGFARDLQVNLAEIADIPAEVIEAAHNCENAGGDAQLLAEFVLELGVKT